MFKLSQSLLSFVVDPLHGCHRKIQQTKSKKSDCYLYDYCVCLCVSLQHIYIAPIHVAMPARQVRSIVSSTGVIIVPQSFSPVAQTCSANHCTFRSGVFLYRAGTSITISIIVPCRVLVTNLDVLVWQGLWLGWNE